MKSNPQHSAAVVYSKMLGETPLEAVGRFRKEYPEYEHEPIAYAGRLDPMASGKLLLLVGDACKERERYLGLDKEYEFEVLLGVQSDTQDILGLISVDHKEQDISFEEEDVEQVLDDLRGKQVFPYPAFSSKTVEGKPLFLWALEGRIDEITRPTKAVEIYDLVMVSRRTISRDELCDEIHSRIARVTPVSDENKALGRDFRRQEVLARWDEYLATLDIEWKTEVLCFRCLCSSGTYMRTLADRIGTALGSEGLAWSIKRSGIGTWDGSKIVSIEDSL